MVPKLSSFVCIYVWSSLTCIYVWSSLVCILCMVVSYMYLCMVISFMYVCMVVTYSKSMDQLGKVADPARGQLNRENEYFPVLVCA